MHAHFPYLRGVSWYYSGSWGLAYFPLRSIWWELILLFKGRRPCIFPLSIWWTVDRSGGAKLSNQLRLCFYIWKKANKSCPLSRDKFPPHSCSSYHLVCQIEHIYKCYTYRSGHFWDRNAVAGPKISCWGHFPNLLPVLVLLMMVHHDMTPKGHTTGSWKPRFLCNSCWDPSIGDFGGPDDPTNLTELVPKLSVLKQ